MLGVTDSQIGDGLGPDIRVKCKICRKRYPNHISSLCDRCLDICGFIFLVIVVIAIYGSLKSPVR